jgi:hypothetical protein
VVIPESLAPRSLPRLIPGDLDRLADMRAALADISNLTNGEKTAFEGNRVCPAGRLAHNLTVVDEAARALSDEFAIATPASRGATGSLGARQDIAKLDERLAPIEIADQDRS